MDYDGNINATTVRCFRRIPGGKLRHGVWLMTQPVGYRGMFVHGDKDEVEPPQFTVEQLAEGDMKAWKRLTDLFRVEEITPEQALAELASWPEAATAAQACFARHPSDTLPTVRN